jgi:hypothetical protein
MHHPLASMLLPLLNNLLLKVEIAMMYISVTITQEIKHASREVIPLQVFYKIDISSASSVFEQ